MKERMINKITLLINCLLYTISGIIIIVFDTKSQNMFHLITSILIILIGITSFILNIINKRKMKDILLSISTYFIGLFFFKNKIKYLSIFPIIFGIYMLLNGAIKLLTYLIFKNKEKRNYYLVLLGSQIDFIFSYLMIKKPTKNINTLTLILGIYLILYGLTYLKDLIRVVFPQNSGKRSLRITPPIIFTVLIPYRVKEKIDKNNDNYNTEIKKEEIKPDLEIFIHVSSKDEGKVGHTDICFNDIVYSYGCYDEDSKKLWKSLGDGTLFKTKEKDNYLKICTDYSGKTIFSFGIKLSKKEKENIERKIKKIEKNTYKWNPNNYKKIKNNYAIKLRNETHAEFYKFKSSNYKTYFLLSTNCVKLVDDILGTTGSDLLKLNGVITPGAYYEYLNKEFKRKNSKIINKKIYKSLKN